MKINKIENENIRTESLPESLLNENTVFNLR